MEFYNFTESKQSLHLRYDTRNKPKEINRKRNDTTHHHTHTDSHTTRGTGDTDAETIVRLLHPPFSSRLTKLTKQPSLWK